MNYQTTALALFTLSCVGLELRRRRAAKSKRRMLLHRRREESSKAMSLLQNDLKLEDPLGYRRRAAKSRRRIWARQWLLEREESRETLSLLQNELKLEDSHGYITFIRMKATEFEEVLAMVAEDIRKDDTIMRMAIPPDQRLAVTLRFLATGETFRSLMFSNKISEQAIGKIVPEVCEAIVRRLGPIFLQEPKTSNDWLQIASGFEEMWDYPLCLGALDGKNIVFRTSEDSVSYFKYKKQKNIVLMALTDAFYKFIFADVVVNGDISDGGLCRSCLFYKKFDEKDFPTSCHLPGSSIPIPYHFIGDNAFALSERVMKSYSDTREVTASRYFNFRLATGNQVVKSSLGVLASRFRVFQTLINLDPKKVELICMAAVILHNFLVSRYSYSYLDFSSLDPVQPFVALKPHTPRSTNMAVKIRNEMRDFFWRNPRVDDD